MEPRIDEMVLRVQQWLNETYGNDSRFNRVNENGKTGWETIYGLRRALQIELGIQETSDSFGPTTYSLCPTITQGTENNMVYIIQGGLWCKGYSPGGFNGYYGPGTYAAVKQLKTDAGFPTASGNMQRDFMKALLDMSAFVCLPNGTEEIRSIQQQLNYDYYDYYQICPCDGLYNRDMNKMLIYALQSELGISKSSATGTWGPTTISKCKEKLFSIGSTSAIVKLIRYAVVCNGYSVSISSNVYDATLDNVLESFANGLLIPKPTNSANYTVIKSLLSSNGDTDRASKGCDTATQLNSAQINTLKTNGYEIVGRYLTKVEGGLDKNLSKEEINRILNAGLSIFPIFQEYGGDKSAFTYEKGFEHANKACTTAENFGIPYYTTIYFAVDYDPQQDEIIENIYNYFKGINAWFSNSDRIYKIGVYGTRNVCRILKNYVSNTFHIDNLFVSDASYGFSGNLGFPMPIGWAFDQFKTDITLGSGTGQIGIDKVSFSRVDLGFDHIEENQKPNPLLKIHEALENIFDYAMSITNNDISKSNLLLTQFLRYKGNYGDDFAEGEKDFLKWSVVGGLFNNTFIETANKNFGNLNFKFNDPITLVEYDLFHWGATLNALLWPVNTEEWSKFDNLIDTFAGWGGDLCTFAVDVKKHENEDSSLYNVARKYICSASLSSSFGLSDYISDIDAVNFNYLLTSITSIPSLFKGYFIEKSINNKPICSQRTLLFISNYYKNNIDGFYNDCDVVISDNILKNMLVKSLEEKYLEAASSAFKDYVLSEYQSRN